MSLLCSCSSYAQALFGTISFLAGLSHSLPLSHHSAPARDESAQCIPDCTQFVKHPNALPALAGCTPLNELIGDVLSCSIWQQDSLPALHVDLSSFEMRTGMLGVSGAEASGPLLRQSWNGKVNWPIGLHPGLPAFAWPGFQVRSLFSSSSSCSLAPRQSFAAAAAAPAAAAAAGRTERASDDEVSASLLLLVVQIFRSFLCSLFARIEFNAEVCMSPMAKSRL